MAIAFGGVQTTAYISTGTTATLAFNVGSGTDRYLLVFVFDVGGLVTGATYAGASMTELGNIVRPGSSSRNVVFGIANPTSGSNDVVVTSSASNNTRLMPIYYTGVGGGATVYQTQSEDPSVTPYQQSITTTTDDCWINWTVLTSAFAITASTNSTFRASGNGSDGRFDCMYDTNGSEGVAGSKTMAVTHTGGNTAACSVMTVLSPTPVGKVLVDNLVAGWNLDESSGNAADVLGSITLTNVGSAAYGTGIIGNGIICTNSPADYLSAAHSSTFNFGTGDFSLSFWAKLNDTTLNATENMLRHYSGGGWIVQFKATNRQVYFYATTTGPATSTTNAIPNDTNWHLYTFRRSGATAEIFVDNVNRTLSGTVGSGTVDVTTDFYIGNNGTSEGFDGTVDAVYLWNRYIQVSEISQLYNSGAGLQYPFSSGGGNTTNFFYMS